MKLYISRTNTPVIPSTERSQITEDIKSSVNMAIENKVKKSSIIIVSDEANIYSDACILRKGFISRSFHKFHQIRSEICK